MELERDLTVAGFVGGEIQVYEVPKRGQPFGIVWLGKVVKSALDVFKRGEKKP
jgi:hypothetical protein